MKSNELGQISPSKLNVCIRYLVRRPRMLNPYLCKRRRENGFIVNPTLLLNVRSSIRLKGPFAPRHYPIVFQYLIDW